LVRRALAIDEAAFGPEHPTVAANLSNLAQLLLATSRPVEATASLRRALVIFLGLSRRDNGEDSHLQDACDHYVALLALQCKAPAEIESAIREVSVEAGRTCQQPSPSGEDP
jgi:hypothetical protein